MYHLFYKTAIISTKTRLIFMQIGFKKDFFSVNVNNSVVISVKIKQSFIKKCILALTQNQIT